MLFTKEELENAKGLAEYIFKGTIIEEGVNETLLQRFTKEQVEFIIKSIVGAFDTGFSCCIHYVLDSQEDE